MQSFCQKDNHWGHLKIGETNHTLKSHGCYIVALACILEIRPDQILGVLNRNRCFNFKGELLNEIAAKALGCAYLYEKENPGIDCVGETGHWTSSGFPQHFFVVLKGSTKIIDPLDGKLKTDPYNVVSYRVWEKKRANPPKGCPGH